MFKRWESVLLQNYHLQGLWNKLHPCMSTLGLSEYNPCPVLHSRWTISAIMCSVALTRNANEAKTFIRFWFDPFRILKASCLKITVCAKPLNSNVKILIRPHTMGLADRTERIQQFSHLKSQLVLCYGVYRTLGCKCVKPLLRPFEN